MEQERIAPKALDERDGNLVDSMLSEARSMDAAQRFWHQAQVVALAGML